MALCCVQTLKSYVGTKGPKMGLDFLCRQRLVKSAWLCCVPLSTPHFILQNNQITSILSIGASGSILLICTDNDCETTQAGKIQNFDAFTHGIKRDQFNSMQRLRYKDGPAELTLFGQR